MELAALKVPQDLQATPASKEEQATQEHPVHQ